MPRKKVQPASSCFLTGTFLRRYVRQQARPVRRGTNGVSTNGVTAIFRFFDRGTFWVLPLTYMYLPKSARACLFSQSVKVHYFCSGPISVDPICPQPNRIPDPNPRNCVSLYYYYYYYYYYIIIVSILLISLLLLLLLFVPICPQPRQILRGRLRRRGRRGHP